MTRKLSAQPAPDLDRKDSDSSPFSRRSRISAAQPLPEPRLDWTSGTAVLLAAYPRLRDGCKRLVKEDGRLTEEHDRMHVAKSMFNSIAFNDDVRTSIRSGETTVTKLLNTEVENLRRMRQQCLAESPMGGWLPR